jgi:hypothetical protein
MTWTSQANLNYQLQFRTNVAQVGWLNSGSPITATGATASTTDTISGTQRYYRVAVQTAGPPSIVHRLINVPMTIDLQTNYFLPAN